MGIEFEDTTGQPRSDEDLQEAIDAMKEVMIKHPFEIPKLSIYAPTILNCLEELKAYRALIKKIQEEKHRQ